MEKVRIEQISHEYMQRFPHYVHWDDEKVREVIAKSVNEALEDAANLCDSVNNHDNPMTAKDCADAIRMMRI